MSALFSVDEAEAGNTTLKCFLKSVFTSLRFFFFLQIPDIYAKAKNVNHSFTVSSPMSLSALSHCQTKVAVISIRIPLILMLGQEVQR